MICDTRARRPRSTHFPQGTPAPSPRRPPHADETDFQAAPCARCRAEGRRREALPRPRSFPFGQSRAPRLLRGKCDPLRASRRLCSPACSSKAGVYPHSSCISPLHAKGEPCRIPLRRLFMIELADLVNRLAAYVHAQPLVDFFVHCGRNHGEVRVQAAQLFQLLLGKRGVRI